MRKLSKHSKVVAGAATFLLLAFAGAHVGALAPQAPRLDSSALRSQNVSAHTLPLTGANLTIEKIRRRARSVFADTSLPAFSRHLRFSVLVSSDALLSNDPALHSAALPRAPPVS